MDTGAVNAIILAVVMTISAGALGQINYPQNPEPVLPPWVDLSDNSERGLRESREQRRAKELGLLIEAYSRAHNGTTPSEWSEVVRWLGRDARKSDWAAIERSTLFVNSIGSVPRSHEIGPLEGRLVLVPLNAIQEERSSESGRFIPWQFGDGTIETPWLVESELKSFSKWSEVEAKIAAKISAVAAMPPVVSGTTASSQMPASAPDSSMLTPSVPPSASPESNSLGGETAATSAEEQTQFSLWIAGIIALVVMVALALRRRA